MELSIIIVNFNVNDWLLKSIKSIYQFVHDIDFEIIVIDNHSTDDSIVNLKNNFPTVKIIENNENVGFAEANNQGIRISEGKLILLLNPDTELFDDSFRELLLFASSMKDTDLCAPCLLNTDHSIQHSTWLMPQVITILKEAFFLNYIFPEKNKITNNELYKTEVDCVSGAAMLFRRELIDKIGYLDKNLFWMDDTDFCYRIKKSSGKIFYISSTRILHHCGKSAAKNQNIVISNQIISKIKFFKKHASFIIFFLSTLFSLIHIINRIIGFGILTPIASFWKKEKAYCYSFIKFIKYIFVADKSIV